MSDLDWGTGLKLNESTQEVDEWMSNNRAKRARLVLRDKLEVAQRRRRKSVLIPVEIVKLLISTIERKIP